MHLRQPEMLGDRRAQHIAQQAQAAALIVRADARLAMQVEAAHGAGVRDGCVCRRPNRHSHRLELQLKHGVPVGLYGSTCPLVLGSQAASLEQALDTGRNELGLDYVSCSPFRVPIARLAAAHAAIAAAKK